jgi:cobalt transporter subunit CbtB
MKTHSAHYSVIAPSLPAEDLPVRDTAIGSKWPALVAVILGAVLIFGVGFSHLGVSHNAAHDTRHAMSFPCH